MDAPTIAKTTAPPAELAALRNLADAVRALLANGGSAFTLRQLLREVDRAQVDARLEAT